MLLASFFWTLEFLPAEIKNLLRTESVGKVTLEHLSAQVGVEAIVEGVSVAGEGIVVG